MTSKQTKSDLEAELKQLKKETAEITVKHTELIDLSTALVAEIDNIMSSKLNQAQVGKILADVITGYQGHLTRLE